MITSPLAPQWWHQGGGGEGDAVLWAVWGGCSGYHLVLKSGISVPWDRDSFLVKEGFELSLGGGLWRQSCSEIPWPRAPTAREQPCSEDGGWVRLAAIWHDGEGDRNKTGNVGWFQKLGGLGAPAREFEEKVEK